MEMEKRREASMEEMQTSIEESGKKIREDLQKLLEELRSKVAKPLDKAKPPKYSSLGEATTVVTAAAVRRRKKKNQKKKRGKALVVGDRKKKRKRREKAMVVGIRKKKKTTKIKKKKNERRTYRWKLTWGGWQRRRRGGRRHDTLQQPSSGRATWRKVGRWRFKLFSWDELADDRRLRKFVDGTFRGGGGGFRWKRVKTRREEAHLGFAWVRGRRGFGQEDGEERETRRKEEWRKGGPSLLGSLVERNMGKRRMGRPLMEARKTEKKGERNEGKREKHGRMKAENQQIRKSVPGMGCHIARWSSLIRNGGPCD